MKSLPIVTILSGMFVFTGCPSDKGEEGETAPSTTQDTSGESSSTTDDTADTVVTGETGGTGETGETTGGPSHVDLFGCGAVPACEEIYAHLDPEPQSALVCAAKVVVSTEPGLVRALSAPGPNIDETDYFVLSLGDGTALVQTRERHCGFDENCDPLPPWEPGSPHQICQLVLADGLAEACASDPPDGSCQWYPMWGGYDDCMEAADYTCEAVLALLK